MSSLAAARADNFYYPPAWRPERGSLNRFQAQAQASRRNGNGNGNGDGNPTSGSRRSRDDAAATTVRFEMPFDARCLHCDASIGRGVRFNARKSRCGAHLSTPRWAFALACPSCRGPLRVETDPARRGYVLTSGVRKRVDTADVVQTTHHAAHDALEGVERLDAPHVGDQLRADPFFRLEREHADRDAARQRSEGLEALLALRDARGEDDYAANAGLRAAFRREKQGRQRRERDGARLGLGFELLDARAEDVAASRAAVFANLPGKEARRRRGREGGGDGRRSGEAVRGAPQQQQQQNKFGSASGISSVASSNGATDQPITRDRSRGSRRPPDDKRKETDSFQHFGDAVGSQLHRLKVAKLAQKRRSSAQQAAAAAVAAATTTATAASSLSLSKSPAAFAPMSTAGTKRRASGSATSVEARARKLLRR